MLAFVFFTVSAAAAGWLAFDLVRSIADPDCHLFRD